MELSANDTRIKIRNERETVRVKGLAEGFDKLKTHVLYAGKSTFKFKTIMMAVKYVNLLEK